MSRASVLRDQARELLAKAKAAEAQERKELRKQRSRAAYIAGGYLIRNRSAMIRGILSELRDKDRAVVEAALPPIKTSSATVSPT